MGADRAGDCARAIGACRRVGHARCFGFDGVDRAIFAAAASNVTLGGKSAQRFSDGLLDRLVGAAGIFWAVGTVNFRVRQPRWGSQLAEKASPQVALAMAKGDQHERVCFGCVGIAGHANV